MSTRSLSIAVIGAGATTLYLLQNLLDDADAVRDSVGIGKVVVFERGDRPGVGMPYNPATTDRHNICNISSEELPQLPTRFADWLRGLDDERLADYDLTRDEIDPSETYARVALGGYFEAQFHTIADRLRESGIDVELRTNAEVIDLRDEPGEGRVCVRLATGGEEPFDKVIIATGHTFAGEDDPDNGYFASPWPIQKLLPNEGEHHDFTVGTLGASLSAFDVVASLAHRHGTFAGRGESLRFEPDPRAPNFRIAMHSAEGWLPHLQYEQAEPMRVVYRHATREQMLDLRDDDGFLRLQRYWDDICRPALADALREDDRADVADSLENGSMSLESLVKTLGREHTYDDAFDGMRRELPEARRSLNEDKPIRWKEVLDDLMYTLNYHAEFLPAEDHARLRSMLMPFLLNVIAAMPLRSARMLLALRDAGRIELVKGRVEVKTKANGETTVTIDDDGDVSERSYRMFVDCSGQGAVTIDDYPFRGLVNDGTIREARATFADDGEADSIFDKHPDRKTTDVDGQIACRLDGIAVDAGYRVLDASGQPNRRVYDIAFPHALGVRPYSYGLQACEHTAGMLVATLLREATGTRLTPDDAPATTALHATATDA